MNDKMYSLYQSVKKTIAAFEEHKVDEGDNLLLAELQASLDGLHSAHPEYAHRHDREEAIRSSFSHEQKEYICAQIADWYLVWKHKLITDHGRHRLGVAKEALKTLILGD